jgi:GntR family transcriptional regulator/MocR family aminotransferase
VSVFNLDNVDKLQPKYLQLASVIRTAIRNGQLVGGDLLPSVQSLSNDLRFNRHTVMKSLGELIAEGWIESQERVGYRVVSDVPIEHSKAISSVTADDEPNNLLSYRLVKSGSLYKTTKASKYQYNFAGGQPDMGLFPFNEFKSYMSDALSRPKLNEFGYGDNAGTPELREEVKHYLRKSRGVTNREILITNGSQEGIYIVAQLLLQVGDKVAVEVLGYPPAMDAFKNAGATIVGIKQDEQGIVPEDLAEKIVQGGIRLIYLTPLHQYPTTITLSVTRRMAIYQLASVHNIPIIEDDYDHEFHYRCQPLPPMAAQDPRQLVIYISTFSKIMFPGARVGFMALSAEFFKAVEAHKMLICHKSNVLMQEALSLWMKSGGFERNLRRVTRQYLKRRDHAVSFLRQLNLFEFTEPDGGMALWLKIKNENISALTLANKAEKLGVFIQHERSFLTVMKGSDECDLVSAESLKNNQYIRLGYAGMNEENFVQGVMILVGILQDKEYIP